MKKISLVITVLIVACFSAQAQQSEGNPFARLGYKADVYTFGETKEFHDLDVVVEIGEVLFNTETNEVVGFIENNDSLIELKPELQSMSIDPHCEKYYSISPYVYCMNNPVNAIDPDGKLVLFINGMHNGDGGQSKYWGGMDKLAMKHLNDYNKLYFDGSMGGAEGLFNGIMSDKILGPHNLKSLNAKDRYTAGYNEGAAFASYILDQLTDGETIKVITHSMGAAYAKGMIQALIDKGVDPSLFAFEADFAPFQPTKQVAVNGIETFQFTNKKDQVANNRLLGSPFGKIEGASILSVDNDKNKGHGISNFIQSILSLPAGKYNIINGQIIPK